METKIPYRFPILRIRDKVFGDVHTYGTDSHDALILDKNGNVMYYNLQNGEGTGESGGYEFVYTPDKGGYDGIREIYLHYDNQSRDYEDMTKDELMWQCMMKDSQIRELLKEGGSDKTQMFRFGKLRKLLHT